MKILHKLRSQSGASMILALVFMLFCMFVGGTVLAAASANGYRVAHLSDQQQYLDERSAALLTAEELRANLGSSGTNKLVINDVTFTVQEIEVGNGGVPIPVGEPTTSRSITFEAPNGIVMTPFQRLMYETTVLRYISENNVDLATVRVDFKNFTIRYEGTTSSVTNIAEFWCNASAGTLNVSGVKDGGASFTDFSAAYECMDGARLYDFVFDFGDFSQLSVACYASLGEREPVEQTLIDEWTATEQSTDESGNVTNVQRTYDAQITTVSRKPVIIWESAKVVKGGG